ncbi:MAG: hypothetical protein FWC55_05415 [Firmicutes bacterium]|nr:hypothetical protein [Bacillota bacterium]
MFKCKPDYEEAQKMMDAFWDNEDAGRPFVHMTYPRPGAEPFPAKEYPSLEARWLDVEYRTEEAAHYMENTVFVAEAMPVVMPNLGPEILSAWAGCPYVYGEGTTWTEPCVSDWETDGDKAVIDMKHPLFAKLEEFTRLLLERGKDSFITGLTDFHPGGDHLAALRDPQALAADLLERPELVKAKLKSSYPEYFAAYDHFLDILLAAGMPIASWLPLTAKKSMYIPSNDFSCMISAQMFEEFFLDGIAEECRKYDRSVYHLDGPGAIRHLDALLAIPELDAVQWVPGAGREDIAQWIGLFRKVLSAGKSVIAYPKDVGELRLLMDALPARGLFLQMWGGVKDADEAMDLMRIIEKWPRNKL